MQVSDFVTNYWKKTRRSGAPWTPQAIADDSGLSIDDVNMFLSWCGAQSVITDQGLIELFNSTMSIIRTPMGNYLGPKGAVGTPGTIGSMPADAYWAQLQKVVSK